MLTDLSKDSWSYSLRNVVVIAYVMPLNIDFLSSLQIIPVMLKESLLERTRNNFMVIEIWNKSLSAENDEVCIPLFSHGFI